MGCLAKTSKMPNIFCLRAIKKGIIAKTFMYYFL